MNQSHTSNHLETKDKTRETNKVVPALSVEEISEELQSLLNDSSLQLTESELVTLRSFEREALDFEVPTCPSCGQNDPFLFKVSGNNCFCCSCGYWGEGEA